MDLFQLTLNNSSAIEAILDPQLCVKASYRRFHWVALSLGIRQGYSGAERWGYLFNHIG